MNDRDPGVVAGESAREHPLGGEDLPGDHRRRWVAGGGGRPTGAMVGEEPGHGEWLGQQGPLSHPGAPGLEAVPLAFVGGPSGVGAGGGA